MRRTMKRILACVLALAMMLGVLPAVSAAEPPTGTVVLADSNGAAPIYIDRDGADYDGLSLISMAVAEDFGAITGQSSKVCAVATAAEAKNQVLEPGIKDNVVDKIGSESVVIIAGTLEDKLIRDLNLDWDITPSGESFKAPDFERYQIKVVASGSQTRVVVAGADKRGAFYGLFHITQDLGGVSPWIWWADVVPAHRDTLAFTPAALETVSRRPSVNYRGFFFNDENPNLDGFADSHYGGLNYLFYNEVFELMIRLKGNYLWPAMWSNSFNSDGVEGMCNNNDAYSSLASGNEFARMEAENHYLLGGAMYVDQPGKNGESVSAPDTNTTNYTQAESQALGQGSLEAIGPGQYPMTLANAVLADRYGVLVGASHHEPMARAGVEWQNLQGSRTYNQPTVNNTALNAWNYLTNPTNISNFWCDGIKRNGSFDNLLTIGMRGENDTALTDANGRELSTKQNAELLKDVIREQDRILHQYGLEDTPQLIALYKEVENCWYGGDRSNPNNADRSAALVFDDEITSLLGADTNRIVMFCEDNNGYLRTLGEYGEKDRFNYGLYYHFDFVGSPHTSMWTNTMPLQRSWDNLTTAYEYGVDDAWMINVGDLKPMELPLSYVMDMAYDFDTYGTAAAEDTDETITWEEYTLAWVKQQFAGGKGLTEEDFQAIADILTDYTHLNGNRKPEQQANNTYSLTAYNEAQETLAFAQRLEENANKYLEKFKGTDLYDAYYQLIYYTGVESATVNQVLIYWGLNRFYANANSALTNVYADKVDAMLANDRSYTAEYNRLGPLLNGKNKWYRMMLASPFNGETVCGLTALGHLNYSGWNRDTAQPFSPTRITLPESGQMRVDVPGSSQPASSGTLTMPSFDSTLRQTYALTLSNTGTAALDYEITGLPDWAVLDAPTIGKVYTGKTIGVSVDWTKLSADATASLKIASGSQSFTVNLSAKVVNVPADVPDGTAFISNDVFSFIATNYTDAGAGQSKAPDGKTVGWVSMPGYGKTNGTMKPFPVYTDDCAAGEGPWLDYKVYVPAGLSGNYQLNIFFGQANDLSFFEGRELNFATQVNGGSITTRNALQNNYIAGNNSNGPWTSNIKECGHVMNYGNVALQEGLNTLRIYAMDQNIMFQKIVLSRASGFQSSYTGAPQSWRKGDPIEPQAMVHDVYDDHEHDYETVVTPPTCTEGGNTAGVCRICGQASVISTTKALGHDWNEGEILVPATKESTGLKKITCQRCGEEKTVRIPRISGGGSTNIDFTTAADAGKYKIAGQSQSAVEEGVGLALVSSQGGIEPAKQSIAEQDIDVVKVDVSGDWTATLEVEFDANGAANGYYQFFGFVASEGGDNQNLVGIRGGDGAMQDFIRKDGAITEETKSSSPGFASAGTYFLRIEKVGDTYTCYRSSDGEEFTEMFAYDACGIEADEILIDAYTGMTAGYKFTLKNLLIEGMGGATEWVEATEIEPGMACVIVADGQFALNNVPTAAGGNYNDGGDSLGATAVTVEDGKITSEVDDSIIWTIEASEGVPDARDGAATYFIMDQEGKQLLRRSGRSGTAPLSVGEMNSNSPQYAMISFYQRQDGSYAVYTNSHQSTDYNFTLSGRESGFDAPGVALDSWDGETYGSSIRLYTLGGSTPVKPDKTALNEIITNAEAIDTTAFTSESVAALNQAIAAAKAVQADPDATQKQIDDAVQAVKDTMDALDQVIPIEPVELNQTIEKAERIDPSKYTDDSVKALEDALKAAKAARDKTDATQAEIDKATEDLKAAIEALVEKPDDDFLFEDVKDSGKFYFEPVYWAFYADPQITKGTDDTHFGPENPCTRGHVVTFLWRAAGEPEPTSATTPFTDLKSGAFYEKAVAWAVEKGITKGLTDTTFGPEATCTRSQIVTFLWRFKEEPAPKSTQTPFTDVNPDGFYMNAVAWAVEEGITKGMTETTFGPEDTCSRGQVVTFLFRATRD